MPHWILTILVVFSAVAACGVAFAQSPLNSALCLILCLAGVAGIYAALGSGFLAIVQVLIYAGAVVTLFVMVVMLLNMSREETLREEITRGRVLGWIVSAFVFGNIFITLYALETVTGPPQAASRVAHVLFTRLALPFELTSLLLLVGVLGVVALARREKGP